ncbi:MAG: signal peptidase II [Chloroflexi bacterium]|nr:signal peptidase II [Chloroflexota bacterium]
MEARTDRGASLVPSFVVAGTAMTLYVADQVSKALVVANVELGQRIEIIGDVVQLWHVRNTGAAFSLFPGATWFFVPVTILALAMVGYFFRAFRDRGIGIHFVLGAIIGGSLGNLTDRLRQGYVVDFVSVGIGDLRWPTFNVADPSVVIGIGLLVAYLTFIEPRRRPADSAR